MAWGPAHAIAESEAGLPWSRSAPNTLARGAWD